MNTDYTVITNHLKVLENLTYETGDFASSCEETAMIIVSAASHLESFLNCLEAPKCDVASAHDSVHGIISRTLQHFLGDVGPFSEVKVSNQVERLKELEPRLNGFVKFATCDYTPHAHDECDGWSIVFDMDRTEESPLVSDALDWCTFSGEQ